MGGRYRASSAPYARDERATASGSTSSQLKTPHTPASPSQASTMHWSESGSSHSLALSDATSSQARVAGDVVAHPENCSVARDTRSKAKSLKGVFMTPKNCSPSSRHLKRGQRKAQQPVQVAGLVSVEAAGIEPASESLPFFDPTCVVRALLRPEGSHGRDPPSRSWKSLATSVPGTLGSQPAL